MATEKESDDESTTVRLTPLIVIEPFSTVIFSLLCLKIYFQLPLVS